MSRKSFGMKRDFFKIKYLKEYIQNDNLQIIVMILNKMK